MKYIGTFSSAVTSILCRKVPTAIYMAPDGLLCLPVDSPGRKRQRQEDLLGVYSWPGFVRMPAVKIPKGASPQKVERNGKDREKLEAWIKEDYDQWVEMYPFMAQTSVGVM